MSTNEHTNCITSKAPHQENGHTINLLMTCIDPAVPECSQEAMSLKDTRGDTGCIHLHHNHLSGASPSSLGGCLGYLLIYFLTKDKQDAISCHLGLAMQKQIKVMKWSDCIQEMKHLEHSQVLIQDIAWCLGCYMVPQGTQRKKDWNNLING